MFCPNSTSFVRYKNNKFLTNHLDSFLAWNLLFLYLTNEVEFGHDILQGYHHIIYMCDFFSEFRWLFCRGLYGFSRRLWFPPDTFPLRFIALWLTMSVRWMKKPTSFVDFLSVVKMLDGDTQIPCEFVLNALFLWCAFQVPIPSGWQSDWLQTRRICCCDQECDNKR